MLCPTWVKGTPEQVCLLSFRLAGRDTAIVGPLFIAFCHICKPCFFFSSISLLGCRWCSGLTRALEARAGAGAGPGRPWDRKAGKGNLGLRDGPRLALSPLLRNPELARERGSSGKTLTAPWTGSSGPPPDDSSSAFGPLKKSKAAWGSAKAGAVRLDMNTKLRGKSIILNNKFYWQKKKRHKTKIFWKIQQHFNKKIVVSVWSKVPNGDLAVSVASDWWRESFIQAAASSHLRLNAKKVSQFPHQTRHHTKLKTPNDRWQPGWESPGFQLRWGPKKTTSHIQIIISLYFICNDIYTIQSPSSGQKAFQLSQSLKLKQFDFRKSNVVYIVRSENSRHSAGVFITACYKAIMSLCPQCKQAISCPFYPTNLLLAAPSTAHHYTIRLQGALSPVTWSHAACWRPTGCRRDSRESIWLSHWELMLRGTFPHRLTCFLSPPRPRLTSHTHGQMRKMQDLNLFSPSFTIYTYIYDLNFEIMCSIAENYDGVGTICFSLYSSFPPQEGRVCKIFLCSVPYTKYCIYVTY